MKTTIEIIKSLVKKTYDSNKVRFVSNMYFALKKKDIDAGILNDRYLVIDNITYEFTKDNKNATYKVKEVVSQFNNNLKSKKMTQNNSNTEIKNQVINLNNGQQYLINRMTKILEHPIMSEKLVPVMMKMLSEWENTAKERELKKIEKEIERLNALKKELSK